MKKSVLSMNFTDNIFIAQLGNIAYQMLEFHSGILYNIYSVQRSAVGDCMNILITNNPLVDKKYKDKLKVEYVDTALLGVLKRVRDFVHLGHVLLSHPLSGSIKPNETWYKSVLISGAGGDADERSVKIIEQCIHAASKFETKQIPDIYLKDLQVIDYSLISDAMQHQ